MFVVPNPVEILEAAKLLNEGNQMFTYLLAFQKDQYKKFWMPNGVLRSKAEIQAVCDAMDAARPGQSAQIFGFGYQIVQLLLAVSPGCLQPEEYTAQYEFDIIDGCVKFRTE